MSIFTKAYSAVKNVLSKKAPITGVVNNPTPSPQKTTTQQSSSFDVKKYLESGGGKPMTTKEYIDQFKAQASAQNMSQEKVSKRSSGGGGGSSPTKLSGGTYEENTGTYTSAEGIKMSMEPSRVPGNARRIRPGESRQPTSVGLWKGDVEPMDKNKSKVAYSYLPSGTIDPRSTSGFVDVTYSDLNQQNVFMRSVGVMGLQKEYSSKILENSQPFITKQKNLYQGLVDTGQMNLEEAQFELDKQIGSYVKTKSTKYEPEFQVRVSKIYNKYPEIKPPSTKEGLLFATDVTAGVITPVAPFVSALYFSARGIGLLGEGAKKERGTGIVEYSPTGTPFVPLYGSYKLSSETKYGIGMLIAGAISIYPSFKLLERSIAFEGVEGLSSKPLGYLSVVKESTGKPGTFALTGFKSNMGIVQKVSAEGKIIQIKNQATFIPTGTVETQTYGKLSYNILGGGKSTLYAGVTKGTLGGKGFAIPISERGALTFSESTILPQYTTGAIFQAPSSLSQSSKVGSSIGKQFVKNLELGNIVRSYDLGASFRVGNDLYLSWTPTEEGRVKDIGFTKIVKPTNMGEPSSVKFFGGAKTPFSKTFAPEIPTANPQLTKTFTETKSVNIPSGKIGSLERINPKMVSIPRSGLISKNLVAGVEVSSRAGLGAVNLAGFNKTKVVYKPAEKLKTPSFTIPFLGSKLGQQQIQKPRLKTSQISSSLSYSSPKITPPYTPTIRVGLPGIIVPPPIKPPKFNLGFPGVGRNLGVKRTYNYTPSYEAWIFNIKGKQSKGITLPSGRKIFTGFETRPIVSGIKKTRKKRKK